MVDIAIGSVIGVGQIIGIILIFLAIVFLFINHGVKTRGLGYVIFITVNAVITISLFKYNITHFNAVEAEQFLILLMLSFYFFIMAYKLKKENPFRFFSKPIFLSQSLSEGVSVVLMSFAYLFAPASIITTLKRALNVMWAMFSGSFFFKEKHFLVKAMSFVILVAGLIFLII